MFIIVRFGIKQHRYYNIESLTASMGDIILEECLVDIMDKIETRTMELERIVGEHEKKKSVLGHKVQILQAKLNIEPEEQPDKKKKAKPKKGKNAGDVNPDEIELQKMTEQLEQVTADLEVYLDKRSKLKIEETTYQELCLANTKMDLLDTMGERKFLCTKRQEQAATYLAERGTYHLCRVTTDEDEEDEVHAMHLEAFLFRSLEDDVDADDTPEVEVKQVKTKKKKR